jgi:disulfide bond formation protein DsbB
MVDSGARPYTPDTYPPNRDWAAYFALLAAGAALVGLVLVPPTRGTRPFWLLTSTLGMGLGIVAYAVAELWWRRNPVPGEGSRLRWWHGLLVAVVGGPAVVVLRSGVT